MGDDNVWVIVEMTWVYDDVDHVGVVGPFPSKDEAMSTMAHLVDDRPSGTSYTVRRVESPASNLQTDHYSDRKRR